MLKERRNYLEAMVIYLFSFLFSVKVAYQYNDSVDQPVIVQCDFLEFICNGGVNVDTKNKL
jgi:hypothetical protein